jgi:hypothetical protein
MGEVMMQSRFAAAVLLIPVAAAGQVQVCIQTRVTSDIDLQVDNPLYGPDQSSLPSGTIMPYQSTLNATARSGSCRTQMTLLSELSYYGCPTAFVQFDCLLTTLDGPATATASTAGELLFHITASSATEGLLLFTFDTRNSYGPTTLGDIVVDIGNDGTAETAAHGECSCVHSYETNVVLGPQGLDVHIVHSGLTFGSTLAPSEYHCAMTMAYLDRTSSVRPFMSGCAPLRFTRWATGLMTFDFVEQRLDSAYFITVGTTDGVLPNGLPMNCQPASKIFAVDMLRTTFALFPATQLPPGYQLVVQGFVFKPNGIDATDSWIVN